MAPQPNRFALDRFKTQLKLSINRLVLLQKKLTGQSLAARKDIAELLKANKVDQAFTKVRYIVRDDFMVEAMEIIQSFCDDLLKSSNLIAITKDCDEFIMEQAKSVIYASSRMDVPELVKVRDLLVEKYTKSIVPDREIGVYPGLVLKLAMSNPERGLCQKYLEAIADNFGIDWGRNEEEEVVMVMEEEKEDFIETSKLDEKSREDALLNLLSSTSSHSLHSNDSTTTNLPVSHEESKLTKSSAPLPMDYSKQQQQQAKSSKQNLPDFDEFTRRFEALRKK